MRPRTASALTPSIPEASATTQPGRACLPGRLGRRESDVGGGQVLTRRLLRQREAARRMVGRRDTAGPLRLSYALRRSELRVARKSRTDQEGGIGQRSGVYCILYTPSRPSSNLRLPGPESLTPEPRAAELPPGLPPRSPTAPSLLRSAAPWSGSWGRLVPLTGSRVPARRRGLRSIWRLYPRTPHAARSPPSGRVNR